MSTTWLTRKRNDTVQQKERRNWGGLNSHDNLASIGAWRQAGQSSGEITDSSLFCVATLSSMVYGCSILFLPERSFQNTIEKAHYFKKQNMEPI